MLTRIEVDGFKTFRDFAADIPPFLVVLGRNASGKSNMFDAIQFLRLTAGGTLLETVSQTRGDITEILHRDVTGHPVETMSFAVETLLDSEVTDDFGDEVPVRHSRLRYELSLSLREVRQQGRGRSPVNGATRERLFVDHEQVTLIRQPNDHWVAERTAGYRQRRNLAKYSSRSVEILLETTKDENGRRVFAIHQEGRAGKPKHLPASDAVATVLSTLTTAHDYPLLYALKRELLSWGLLHLDPAALRHVNSFDDDDRLSPTGANLAKTLHRIALDTSTEDRPRGSLTNIAADLARIVPEVRDLQIDEDRERRQRQVVVHTREDATYTARVASDGTLRALALLTALYDPSNEGLICFEEPENGIYPQRLVSFVRHLRALVDQSFRRRLGDAAAPAVQLILSSHSPVIVRALSDDQTLRVPVRDDVLFVDTVSRHEGGRKSRVSRARKIRAAQQMELPLSLRGRVVSKAEIEAFEVSGALT
jgi:predicted ATPase